MSDDWQAGDLALCIKAGPWRSVISLEITSGPRAGRFLTVSRVEATDRYVFLRFVEWPGESASERFVARRFRKIRPHVPDAEDAETIRLLTGKPAKVGA